MLLIDRDLRLEIKSKAVFELSSKAMAVAKGVAKDTLYLNA